MAEAMPHTSVKGKLAPFGTVLIANRGEIALRIARTCRELGIRTVVAYSTADRDSAAVRFADDSRHIGPTAAKRSYLNIAAIIEAAKQTGAEAIHPGYGFLSEDADLAEVVAAHGMTFIGPAPEVMSRLSDKAVARSVMAAAGLPVLPGGETAANSLAEALEVAERISDAATATLARQLLDKTADQIAVQSTPSQQAPSVIFADFDADAQQITRQNIALLECQKLTIIANST